MNGCVIPNTPIAVDFWKVRECPHVRLFFLTHLHGDHIAGLTSSWNYPIHCSEVTGRLLKYKYALKEELFKILEIDTPTVVFLDRENKEQMTVTALDANHCPGAVMFLFEGYFGRILHTGDFRYNPQMLLSPPLSLLTGKIDTLYLDNTYCSPGCVFPDRDEATEMIIKIIKSHPNHRVVVAMRTLGKEELLHTIAMHCKTWISVPPSYFDTLRILEVQNVFKNNCSDCQIQVVPFHKISNKFIANLNQQSPTIVILPTALYCGIDAEPYSNNENVFIVPYSDHSSYTELVTFVSTLRPQHIVPVVKSKSRGPFGVNIADRSDMTCFQKYLNKRETRHSCVPLSVKTFMKDYQASTVTNGKVIKSKKRHLKAKINRRQKQKGILYQSPRKTELSVRALSTQNHNMALGTRTSNLQGTIETHSDNLDVEDNEALKVTTTKPQNVGYHMNINISIDEKENGEKHQYKTSQIERQKNVDHRKISSAARTTSASVDINSLSEKPGSRVLDSENLALNLQDFKVKDNIREIIGKKRENHGYCKILSAERTASASVDMYPLSEKPGSKIRDSESLALNLQDFDVKDNITEISDTDVRELSDDNIFAIPETPINVIQNDACMSNDLDIEPVTSLCCNVGRSDLHCIKSRHESGTYSQQSVCSGDYTEKCQVISDNHIDLPRERPIPEDSSKIYANRDTVIKFVPEVSTDGNTGGSLQERKDCRNETVVSSLPGESGVSSLDVLQSSPCENIYKVDVPVKTSSCINSTKDCSTTDRYKLMEILNKSLKETDKGYVCDLFDSIADTGSFNFVSVSARKKNFRRQRLYKNLSDGIQKM